MKSASEHKCDARIANRNEILSMIAEVSVRFFDEALSRCRNERDASRLATALFVSAWLNDRPDELWTEDSRLTVSET
ncbi:MAG: hypothetical protein HYY84_06290 [Deltaproteobacteria bacterium]|nr:hypothetical protein [Deltaproteobacteria bacterium]